MQLLQGGTQALIVAAQSAETAEPSETAPDHPAAGQQHKAGLVRGLLNHLQVNIVNRRRIFGFLARIALVRKAHRHGLAGNFLHLPTQLAHLRLLLLVGRGDDHAQQLAQRIDGDVGLAALAPLGPIPAGAVPAFGRALQRAPVEHNGRRGGRSLEQQALQLVHIVHDVFKYARVPSTGPLLVDRGPRRQVVRQVAPRAARVGQVA